MAREQKDITITEQNRDFNKKFRLTEMPALRAERWATRLFLGLAKSGVDIPDNIQNAGMAAVAALAFKTLSGIDYEFAEPLLDEMLTCVRVLPDPRKPDLERDWIEEDFEEVTTILRLRKEVFELHTNFFKRAKPLTSPTPE